MPVQTRGRVTVAAVAPEVDAALAPTLRKPFRRFVGIDGGCSCGFPSLLAPIEYFDGLFQGDTAEERAHAIGCIRGLFAVVADALLVSESVELYPAWAQQEALPAEGRVVLRLDDVVAEQFFFVERFVLQIRRA